MFSRRATTAASASLSSGLMPKYVPERWSAPRFHRWWWPNTSTGPLVEPGGLVGAELTSVGAGDDGVDDRERHAVDVHVVRGVAGRELWIGLHVVVAAHPLHALAERAVRVEE